MSNVYCLPGKAGGAPSVGLGIAKLNNAGDDLVGGLFHEPVAGIPYDDAFDVSRH